MKKTLLLLAALLAAFVSAAPPSAGAAPRARRAPTLKAEITAVVTVESSPRATTHKNGRRFLEFMALVRRFELAPLRGSEGAELPRVIATRPVRGVHDLTCGGEPVGLRLGDAAELKGEYVHPPSGQDLIHFTHPADGSCGGRGTHPDGYLRRAR